MTCQPSNLSTIGAEAQRRLALAGSAEESVDVYVSFVSDVSREICDQTLTRITTEKLDGDLALAIVEMVLGKLVETLRPSPEYGLPEEWHDRIDLATIEAIDTTFWQHMEARLKRMPPKMGGVQ